MPVASINVPDFTQYNFVIGDTTEVVTKQNGMNAALEKFGSDLNTAVDEINAAEQNVEQAAQNLDADQIMHAPDSGLPNEAGVLALIDQLSDAPIGNLSAFLSALGKGNAFFEGSNANDSWPNDSLDDVDGVPMDFYWCPGSVSDRPVGTFGICLHIPLFGSDFYQVYMSGFGAGQDMSLSWRKLYTENEAIKSRGWNTPASYKNADFSQDSWFRSMLANNPDVDGLGSIIFARSSSSNVWFSTNVPGSSLTASGIRPDGSIGGGNFDKSLTGTWKCIGWGGSSPGTATLFKKIEE